MVLASPSHKDKFRRASSEEKMKRHAMTDNDSGTLEKRCGQERQRRRRTG